MPALRTRYYTPQSPQRGRTHTYALFAQDDVALMTRTLGEVATFGDGATLDDPHELTDAMVAAFIEIRRAAGLSEELTVVPSAMAPRT